MGALPPVLRQQQRRSNSMLLDTQASSPAREEAHTGGDRPLA